MIKLTVIANYCAKRALDDVTGPSSRPRTSIVQPSRLDVALLEELLERKTTLEEQMAFDDAFHESLSKLLNQKTQG